MQGIEKVQKIFYDKIYAHEWIGQYFKHIEQKYIESQQTKFMASISGGPKNYSGLVPKDAHRMFIITDELFDLRQKLLREALEEADLDDESIEEWIKKDSAFRGVVVKSECKKLYDEEPVLYFQNTK